MRTRSKVAVAIGGTLAVAAGITLALHLAPVRGALGWAPLEPRVAASCPFGFGAQVARVSSVPRPIPPGPRPALGFALDVTTRAEVKQWARTHELRCTDRHRGTVLDCADVPAALAPGALAATSLWFRFDAGVLAGIQTVRRTEAVTAVVDAFGTTESVLTTQLGAPTQRAGVAQAEELARGTLRQAMVEYRAPAYRAVVRATNMGDGYVLTESFASSRALD